MFNIINFNNSNIVSRNKPKSYKFSYKNQTSLNNQSFSGANLKPLSKDCVSFSGKLNRALLEGISNQEACSKVYNNAKVPSERLNSVLFEYLKDCFSTNEEQNIISIIERRIKTPESIREKAADIFETEISSPAPKVFNIKDAESIKTKVHDIIGARIILQDAQHYKGDLIIDRIIQMVKDKKIKIVKIESYGPNNLDADFEYFRKEKLEELKNAVNEVSDNDNKVEIKQKSKTSGYIALHLDIDLSDADNLTTNQDKYFGEIQIVGKDVAQLKDIEDFCYKLKDGKDIKGNDVNYQPFVQHFLKFYNPDNEELVRNFDEYTYRAYMIQREKNPKDNKNSFYYHLPTIHECGMDERIPLELDFNILEAIKYNCDNIAKIQSDPKNALNKILAVKSLSS